MLDARFAALALAVGFVAAPTPRPATSATIEPAAPATNEPAAAAAVGSPLICFPLDIGAAESLPFGSNGLEVKTSMKPDEVAATLCLVLGKSDDVVVHMETLRRAAIWLMSMESETRGAADPRRLAAAKVQSLLTNELLVVAADGDSPARTRAEALRWFDLGYFLAAGGQAGVCELGSARAFLEKSARLAPDDLALRFGVALGEYEPWVDKSATGWARHLVRLFDGAAPPDAGSTSMSLRKNVLATFGAFLDRDEWDKLGAEVRKHVGRT